MVLLTRRVAAAPTTVAATAIEDAVSTSPAEMTFLITPLFLDLIGIEKSCPLRNERLPASSLFILVASQSLVK